MTTSNNDLTQRLDSIDSRLDRLVGVAEQLADGIGELREGIGELKETVKQQGQNIDRMAQNVERMAQNMDRIAQNFERFVSILGKQADAITELTRDRHTLLEAAQRSAQASEAAAVVAQSNQNAIRDLIQELREGR